MRRQMINTAATDASGPIKLYRPRKILTPYYAPSTTLPLRQNNDPNDNDDDSSSSSSNNNKHIKAVAFLFSKTTPLRWPRGIAALVLGLVTLAAIQYQFQKRHDAAFSMRLQSSSSSSFNDNATYRNNHAHANNHVDAAAGAAVLPPRTYYAARIEQKQIPWTTTTTSSTDSKMSMTSSGTTTKSMAASPLPAPMAFHQNRDNNDDDEDDDDDDDDDGTDNSGGESDSNENDKVSTIGVAEDDDDRTSSKATDTVTIPNNRNQMMMMMTTRNHHAQQQQGMKNGLASSRPPSEASKIFPKDDNDDNQGDDHLIEYTAFDDFCFLKPGRIGRRLQQMDVDDEGEEEEEEGEMEDHNVFVFMDEDVEQRQRRKLLETTDQSSQTEDDPPASAPVLQRKKAHAFRDKSVGRGDTLVLGRCRFEYPMRFPPADGYLKAVDYFHQRRAHARREACHAYCVTQLDDSERHAALLIAAAQMGLQRAAGVLVRQYGVDPLKRPRKPPGRTVADGYTPWNAAQEAIRGGHAALLHAMIGSTEKTGNDDDKDSQQQEDEAALSLVIDEQGRTVRDYLMMRGCAIRPVDAKKYFGLDTTKAQKGVELGPNPDVPDLEWNTTSARVPSTRCDFDVIQANETYGGMTREQFYRDYFTTGRPFVLRGVFSTEELSLFSRHRLDKGTVDFRPSTEVVVGPTGYPSLTGQKHCTQDQTIAQLENATECADMPGVPMLHSRHPKPPDWQQLYPPNGEWQKGGWSTLGTFFATHPESFVNGWQVFFGGDGSGATLHWHNAALNVLYVGIKEWTVTPPHYRGFTGMPSHQVLPLLDKDISLTCTQGPGDLIFIPDYWGHLTLNSGFTIGAAVIPNLAFRKWAHATAEDAAAAGQLAFTENVYKNKMLEQIKTRVIGDPALKNVVASSDGSESDKSSKILFVHINKTGGTSMIRMLEERCPAEYSKERWEGGHRTFHATAHAQIEHYGRSVWDAAYTFAIVRHPLARQVSNFFFLIGRCQRNYSPLCSSRKIPKDLKIDTDEEKIHAFHEYTHTLYEMYPPGSQDSYLFGSAGHGNEQYATMNATQTSWLVDPDGNMAVKGVFKLENLSENMNEMVEAMPCLKDGDPVDNATEKGVSLQRTLRGLVEAEVEMVHLNESPKYPDYRLFGKNEKTNQILKEVFSVDYKNFGYEIPLCASV